MSYYNFKNKPFFKTEKVYIETKIEEILVSFFPPKEKKKIGTVTPIPKIKLWFSIT